MRNKPMDPVGARQQTDQNRSGSTSGAFARRALIAGAVLTLVILILVFFWYAGNVLLLVFAAILVGVFLHGLSDWVRKHTPLSYSWSLAAVVPALLVLFGLSAWLFAASLIEQADQLTGQLPRAVQQLRQRLEQNAWGRQALAQLPRTNQAGSGSGSLMSAVSGFFTASLSGLVNVVVVLIVGLYLAAAPDTYTNGLVRLVPQSKRERAREVLGVLGYTLRWWLIGRFTVMAANGVLTGVALWMLGIPLAFTLGLLTGILNFIPNIGPILAAIPAVLLGLTVGSNKALYVVLLYVVIQNLEGFVLTPLVQQRTVALPPAVIILSQVLLGVLMGSLGVLLATPLAASVLVLVKLLYIEDVLGDPVDVPGEQGI